MSIETREILISPDSKVTPAQMKGKILAILSGSNRSIKVKETCYGALVEGEADELKQIIDEVREMDRNGIYSKPRGFPIGDPRICRATRRGGPRPGFHQLELEHSLLPKVRRALDKIEGE
ncbi:MAG: methanogenesis marker protein 6 [Methanophagales archaeon]|nr:methanogenesis marker protein 6 [Methanophagales archaeon]MCW7073521.1 methanogenesis marker protein 6 [Methanophagales archaeon]